MKRYCVNKNAQSTGEHEVHVWDCKEGPKPENKFDLGEHDNCQRAILVALLRDFKPVDGCKFCCPDCHTR